MKQILPTTIPARLWRTVLAGLLCLVGGGNPAFAQATVQHFGSDTDVSWATSSSTTNILSGSTVTLDGLTMTFMGTDNTWEWSTNKGLRGLETPQRPKGTVLTKWNSETDEIPTHGSFYKFEATKAGVLSVVGRFVKTKYYVVKETGDGGPSNRTAIYNETGPTNAAEKTIAFDVEPGATYYFFQLGTALNANRFELKSISYALLGDNDCKTWNFLEEIDTWKGRGAETYDGLTLEGTFTWDATSGRIKIEAGSDGKISFTAATTGYLVIMGKSNKPKYPFNLEIGSTSATILGVNQGSVYCRKITVTDQRQPVTISATETGNAYIHSIAYIPENSDWTTRTASATLDAKGFATYCPAWTVKIPEAVDGQTQVKAYYMSAASGSTLTFKEITTGNIPGGCAVLLTGDAGATYNFSNADKIATGDSRTAIGLNSAAGGLGVSVLHPAYKSGIKASANCWAYMKDSGLYAHVTEGLEIPEGKAWVDAELTPSQSDARGIAIVLDGNDPTGISEVTVKAEETRNGCFDLQGRRVTNPVKGLYIVNGKKVVIK